MCFQEVAGVRLRAMVKSIWGRIALPSLVCGGYTLSNTGVENGVLATLRLEFVIGASRYSATQR